MKRYHYHVREYESSKGDLSASAEYPAKSFVDAFYQYCYLHVPIFEVEGLDNIDVGKNRLHLYSVLGEMYSGRKYPEDDLAPILHTYFSKIEHFDVGMIFCVIGARKTKWYISINAEDIKNRTEQMRKYPSARIKRWLYCEKG